MDKENKETGGDNNKFGWKVDFKGIGWDWGYGFNEFGLI